MNDKPATQKRTKEIAEVFDLNELKDFAPDKRVRKRLFKSEQLWSEMACYEPGQSTVMHQHPFEEEMIHVVEGTANINVGGEELQLRAGSLVKFPPRVMHDVRNLQPTRCVIVFTKVPTRLAKLATPSVD